MKFANEDAAAELEIRREFEHWFNASRSKDGCMSHFAPDAVSFEHVPPLQVKGVDAIRKICQAGFDAFKGRRGRTRVGTPGLLADASTRQTFTCCLVGSTRRT